MRYLTPTAGTGPRAWPPTLTPIQHGTGGGGGGGGGGSDFVTLDSGTGNLMLNGSRYRFSGVNVANDIGTVSADNGNGYGGSTDAQALYITSHTQVDAVLTSAQGMNARVLRVYSAVLTVGSANTPQPSLGTFNDAALEPLDYLLSRCPSLGMKVVIPLTDNRDGATANSRGKWWYCAQNSLSPDGTASQFYSDGTVVDSFKDFISHLLDHVNPYTLIALKDDPNILAWESINEGTTGVTGLMNTWITDIASYIKTTKGAQQLVMDGRYGVGDQGADEIAAVAIAETDIMSDHTYDSFRTPAYLASEGEFCHDAGKAFYVGEFDWTDARGLSWNLSQLLDTAEDSPYIDGTASWDLLADLTSWLDGFTLKYPGTNANMQTRGDMLADHALRMTGITPGTFVSDSLAAPDGTALADHVGETGATWRTNAGWTGVSSIQSNRLYGGSSQGRYYSSGVPASSDYTVSADIYTASALSGSYAGVLARVLTRLNYSYTAYVINSGGTVTLNLDYTSDSGGSSFGSVGITAPTVASTHTLKLTVSGTSLSLYWDGVLKIGPITNSALVAAGRAGLVQGGGGSTTTGFHIANPSAAA